MRKRCLWFMAALVFVVAVALQVGSAAARQDCPRGYYQDGPRGCMPQPYPYPYPYPYPPRPPYVYAPPPPPIYPSPCPPGTIRRQGICRPVQPPPSIYIGPPVYYYGW